MLAYKPVSERGHAQFSPVLCGENVMLAEMQHTRVRKMYGIPGGVGSDVLERRAVVIAR